MAAYFDGGIAQVSREIDLIEGVYPEKMIPNAPP